MSDSNQRDQARAHLDDDFSFSTEETPEPLFKENVFDTLTNDPSVEGSYDPDNVKPDIFATPHSRVDNSKKIDFSQERKAIQAEQDLVSAIIAPLNISADTKKELITFAVDYYDITPQNALTCVKEASHELREQMRDLIEAKGVWVNYDGTVSPDHSMNQKLLTDPEMQAYVDAYQELSTLDSFIDNKIDTKKQEEINEHDGEVLFTAITKYGIDSQAEEEIVGLALEKFKQPGIHVTSENADALLLKAADYLKTTVLVHFLHLGFSTNEDGNLTLPTSKKDILNDPQLHLRERFSTLKGAYKITDPQKFSSGEKFKIVLVDDSLENAKVPAETPNESLRKSLEQFGFSKEAVTVGTSPEIVALMGASTISTLGTSERGLLGFNQVVDEAINTISKKNGFTLDAALQPVLSENWFQKNLLFWTKADRLNKIKNSPEYQKIIALHNLQKEILQKHQAILKKRQVSNKAASTDSNLVTSAPINPVRRSAAKNLGSAALAGAAAGILTGSVMYKDKGHVTPTSRQSTENVYNEIKPDNQARARELEDEESQTIRPTEDEPIVPKAKTAARAAEPEKIRERATLAEPVAKPSVSKPETKVDPRFANTKFKKPASTSRRPANSNFKIDPFTYQSTDPNTAPKLERPKDLYPIEEAPELDIPLPTNRRTAKKAEPLFEPGVIYQDNRLPRTKQKPEVKVAMPDLSTLNSGAPEPSTATKRRQAREKVLQALLDQNIGEETDEHQEVGVDSEPTGDSIDESKLNNFETFYELGTEIRTKGNQISNFELDRARAEANAADHGLVFNSLKWERGTQTIKDQFEKDWAEFSNKKLEALQNGRDYLANLKNKLDQNPDLQTTKQLKKQIADLEEKLFFFEKIISESKESLTTMDTSKQDKQVEEIKKKRAEELQVKQQQEEDENIKKLIAAKQQDLHPVLKPTARKKSDKDSDNSKRTGFKKAA